jgi:hypothetical protein
MITLDSMDISCWSKKELMYLITLILNDMSTPNVGRNKASKRSQWNTLLTIKSTLEKAIDSEHAFPKKNTVIVTDEFGNKYKIPKVFKSEYRNFQKNKSKYSKETVNNCMSYWNLYKVDDKNE